MRAKLYIITMEILNSFSMYPLGYFLGFVYVETVTCGLKRVSNADTTAESHTKRIKHEICDIDQLDIGRFVLALALNDDTKLDIINNHWQLGQDFKFPSSQFGSSHRKFSLNWLTRWSCVCYSKMYDGAFCLSCVLFGRKTGHNRSKLNKLFKEPLKNWQTAAGKLEKHQKQSLIHRDSMLRLLNFESVMMGETKGIDEQADKLRSALIKENREIRGSITKTVILTGRQNMALPGHCDNSQHFSLLDTKLEEHFESGNKNDRYRSKTIENKLIKICRDQIREAKLYQRSTSVAVPYIQFLQTKQQIAEVLNRCQLSCATLILTKKLINGSLNS